MNNPPRALLLLAMLLLTSAVVFVAQAADTTETLLTPDSLSSFLPATQGCPMAHCDAQMTDWENALSPEPGAQLIWRDPREGPPGLPLGSGRGLGCAGNGEIVACSLGRVPEDYPDVLCDPQIQDTLVVYGYSDANKPPYFLWSSGELLNCSAFTSAPLVGAAGSIIAADDGKIIRFGPNGTPVWQTPTAGGSPISPILLNNDVVVLVTVDGPISAYDAETGELLAELVLAEGNSFYETINTPAASGNRLYVSTQLDADPVYGRLYALDFVPAQEGRAPEDTLQVAWYFDFGGPSGASPLLVGDTIYFDGDRPDPLSDFAPHIYAVQDTGGAGQLLWTTPAGGEIQASFARDPRGGFWTFTIGTPVKDHRWLTRMRLTDQDGDGFGDVLERIDLDALLMLPGIHIPSSVMSIAGTAEAPVMIVGATAFDEEGGTDSTYIVAIDLNTRTRLWRVWLPADLTAGQFSIALGEYGPRVFFTNKDAGVWVIGKPLQYRYFMPSFFHP